MPAPTPLVLLAEDDHNIRETTEDLLSLAGIRVISAPTGRVASAILQREKVDLVITDLVMPDGDGLWLLGVIREAPLGRRPPVILLTAHADTTEKAAGARARAEDYLAKPFDPDQLISKVRRWLEPGPNVHPTDP